MVALSRDSYILEHFIATGEVLADLDSAKKNPLNVNQDGLVGLSNIGNTCYLNSLLQFYYSCKPLRQLVLEEEFNSNETSDARRFAYELKTLFCQLDQTSDVAVTPDKKLAEMALGTQNSYGEQQDISECMDSIFDYLNHALKHHQSEFESYVTFIF
jgi:ubiquitin carboxyl-terminal hydrolase 25/28